MEENKEEKLCKTCSGCRCHHHKGNAGMGGGFYGLAFIGSIIYFMQGVTTFSAGIMALLKSIVWPAILVYKLFLFLA